MVIRCAGRGEVVVELNDTETAKTVHQALPLSAEAQTWGEEVYFSTPLSIAQEAGTLDCEVGDVGWWPPGHALAIFFGRTPASSGPKPVPASDVTIVGRVVEGLDVIREVAAGDKLDLVAG
jgi:hypothetical protein